MMVNPWNSLRFNTHFSCTRLHPRPFRPQLHQSPSYRPGKMSQSPVSRNSNIERGMDRPKSVGGVIRQAAGRAASGFRIRRAPITISQRSYIFAATAPFFHFFFLNRFRPARGEEREREGEKEKRARTHK